MAGQDKHQIPQRRKCTHVGCKANFQLDMLHEYLESYINTKSFSDFKLSAENYCVYLENLSLSEKDSFPLHLKSLLADLYASALKLPEVDLVIVLDYEDKNLRDKLISCAKEFGGIASNILGNNQFYRTAFAPDNMDTEELSHGFLIDDIQDIYIDIKESLELLKTNENVPTQQALWDIKFSLRSHWGEHCVSALHFLHYLCQKYG